MSQDFKIVLPDPTAQQLYELAAQNDQRPATLASQMIQNEIALAADTGHVRPLKQTPALTRHPGAERAPWLEPYGGDPDWRTRMWGSIVALHARYPRHLQYLKNGWWNDPATTDALCALATWRQEIDDTSNDPRDELSYQHQLTDYSNTLKQQGTDITTTWKPSTPPDDWNERA
jgi:hypothetical protein